MLIVAAQLCLPDVIDWRSHLMNFLLFARVRMVASESENGQFQQTYVISLRWRYLLVLTGSIPKITLGSNAISCKLGFVIYINFRVSITGAVNEALLKLPSVDDMPRVQERTFWFEKLQFVPSTIEDIVRYKFGVSLIFRCFETLDIDFMRHSVLKDLGKNRDKIWIENRATHLVQRKMLWSLQKKCLCANYATTKALSIYVYLCLVLLKFRSSTYRKWNPRCRRREWIR